MNPVGYFKKVFDDFRTSYVLRYTPTGVEPGRWHDLKVELPNQRGVTIRARQGYHGG